MSRTRPVARRSLWARGADRLRRLVVVDRAPGVAGTVMLASSARSGSTWMAGCLARALRARRLFEPFVVDDQGRLASLTPESWSESRVCRGFSRYLPEQATGDPWVSGVESVLAGAVRHVWHDENRPGLYRRRVVKAVRANLLLGHVTARWPALPVVWLVRDPVEVVASQIRMRDRGWDFDWSPGYVLNQPELMRDWLSPFEDVFREAEGLVDRLAVRWCVENYVPWRQPSVAEGAVRLGYRELCTGIEAWRALSQRLVECGLADPAHLDEVGVLHGLRSEGEGAPREGHGAATLSLPERARVMQLVERFGLQELAWSSARAQ